MAKSKKNGKRIITSVAIIALLGIGISTTAVLSDGFQDWSFVSDTNILGESEAYKVKFVENEFESVASTTTPLKVGSTTVNAYKTDVKGIYITGTDIAKLSAETVSLNQVHATLLSTSNTTSVFNVYYTINTDLSDVINLTQIQTGNVDTYYLFSSFLDKTHDFYDLDDIGNLKVLNKWEETDFEFLTLDSTTIKFTSPSGTTTNGVFTKINDEIYISANDDFETSSGSWLTTSTIKTNLLNNTLSWTRVVSIHNDDKDNLLGYEMTKLSNGTVDTYYLFEGQDI